MFREITNELMSIMSDEPIEKIAHLPNKSIAKTMDLIYHIKFEDIERMYTEKLSNMIRTVIVYKSDRDQTEYSMCMIEGQVYHITFIPTSVLSKEENNAITLCKGIIRYVGFRAKLIMYPYKSLIEDDEKSSVFEKTFVQSIPVITCHVMRKLYSGAALPIIIYNSLSEILPIYKKIISQEGISSILDLMDEGLTIDELIDNSLICAISKNDKKYPGIWGDQNNEEVE